MTVTRTDRLSCPNCDKRQPEAAGSFDIENTDEWLDVFGLCEVGWSISVQERMLAKVRNLEGSGCIVTIMLATLLAIEVWRLFR